ncbi:alpha,alpha-phosphotrehalase [Rothia dentocariosa]|uniref:Alpha,alpha-phosphotrehalase n=1 Tax=Rothia dentocariosa TaxID=2047 RepID=A0AAE5NHA1_9MICC|nr:alpha,alpha-phosphotrehalase [Rothia dentocariosa]PAK85319.1 alpha,alpha-phosphotrehalase [Rothia dentocariosa]
MHHSPAQFRSTVIYQIYPKSFYSAHGRPTGDIRGIIEKVPYVASLGVGMVWFNPFFASPQHDNGYDISDYYAINPELGTMEDVEEMIAAFGEHGIGVMFDMVLNHVSTKHEWFNRAQAGEREYWDYFYLRPGRVQSDGTVVPPTNWESKFGGSAWAPFTDTAGEVYRDESGAPLYYLHLYDVTQADLNWYNPAVREELYKVVNFWYDKGVRGFRFDVINVIGKSEELEDAPAGVVDKTLYTDTPIVHTRLRELNRVSFGRYGDTVTVGEMSSTSIENCVGYSNPENRELDMVFSFHHLKVDYEDGEKWSKVPFRFAELKGLLNDWALGMQAGGGWNALFWNNHDQPRALNRFGDIQRYRAESATMLATVIHLLRGTPYIYQGEEIGMIDPVYSSIDDYVDVEAHNAYKTLRARGLSEGEALEVVRAKARDNSRVPMQWESGSDGERGAVGFGTATPWLTPAPSVDAATGAGISVADEERDGMILPYYRELIRLRGQYPVISEGSYTPYALDHERVFGYLREHITKGKRTRLLVLNNFFGDETAVRVPAEFMPSEVMDAVAGSKSSRVPAEAQSAQVLLCNYKNPLGQVSGISGPEPREVEVMLRPYESLALIVEEPIVS